MGLELYVQKHLARGQLAGEKAKVMLLSCIDYRYPHRISDVMDRWGLRGKYDQFILAGASLGVVQSQWRDIFVEHVLVARKLHHEIERIVILDHRDCGAYKSKELLDPPLPADVLPSVEKAKHEEIVKQAMRLLKQELGGDFAQVSHHEVARVERLLNERPRKRLGYRTPVEQLGCRLCCI